MRPRARVRPTSCARRPGAATRRACSRPAWARSADSVRADSGHGAGGSGSGRGPSAGPPSRITESSCPGPSTASACSRMTCALVPLIPKDDTPARRGRPRSGHATASVSSSTEPDAQSTCGVGSVTCRVRGSTPWRIACTILMTPATPAAAWVWPMFDLSDPSSSGSPSARP